MTTNEDKVDYTLHYETWHTVSDAHKAYMSAFYNSVFEGDIREILSRLRKTTAETKVLDFGCGMGLFLNYLRASGFTHVSGFELDEGQAHCARSMGLSVAQNADPMAWLAQCDAKFDIIFAIDVLEHVPVDQLQKTLTLMRNLLTPQGFLVATVPNANSTLAGRWRYIDWTHRTSFTEHSLSHVFKLSGFDVERVVPSEIVRFYKNPQGFVRRFSEGLILKFVRLFRRLELIGEFGWDEGLEIPITTNIRIFACKK